MEIKCSICGKKQEITKIHKDYQKLAKNPDANFICHECELKLKNQAEQKNKKSKHY